MLIEKWEAIHKAVEWGNCADLYLKMFLDEHYKYYEAGRRALDLGCGVGANCGLLLKAGFEVWGNDCSKTAVEKARLNYPDENFHPFVSSFEELTFYDNFFDLVVSVVSIEQLPSLEDMEELMSKVRKWLKPHGRVFIKLLAEPIDKSLFRAPVILCSRIDIEDLMEGFEYGTAKVEGVTSNLAQLTHNLVIGRLK